ncbi:MAG: FkbM family methyltransferase [Planctomycetaceae bacterium]|jgi:FkbM family methyltransferase|nr:FkbM family methyltransferase [Planctomycetaceae bacterium]
MPYQQKSFKNKVATFLLYHLTGKVAFTGVLDVLGGSFKDYCFDENMKKRLAELKKNLDTGSIETIDFFMEMIKYAPKFLDDWNDSVMLVNPKSFVPKHHKELAREFIRNYKYYQKKYPLPVRSHAPDVFLFHNGLTLLPQKVVQYIGDKDFIDGGAYVGDSVLILNEYNPRKIYSFEISEGNSLLFQKTMKMNNITPDKVELVPAGLGENDSEIFVTDFAHSGSNIYEKGDQKIHIRSVDSFTSERNLSVGLIKCDIEGSESLAVRGMIETIKRDRPVLSIAIYHNPRDFFEIKPYLESLDLNYKWMIRHLTPINIIDIPFNHEAWEFRHICLYDFYLLGYPAELAGE